jgi:hypothetical protein
MSDRANRGRDLPSPIAEALFTLADRLSVRPVTWSVGGSVARWLRGFEAVPEDIDLDTGSDYSYGVFHALQDFLVSPPATPDRDHFPCTIARYDISGVPVEVIVDLHIRARCEYRGIFSSYQGRVIGLPFRGRAIPVTPLEESILVNIVMDRWDRLAEFVASRAFRPSFDLDYFTRRAAEIALPDEVLQRFLKLADL